MKFLKFALNIFQMSDLCWESGTSFETIHKISKITNFENQIWSDSILNDELMVEFTHTFSCVNLFDSTKQTNK